MEGFCNVLEACQLSDLGFKGLKFMWNNERSDGMFTEERLDRVVENSGWCMLF